VPKTTVFGRPLRDYWRCDSSIITALWAFSIPSGMYRG
jgi:hypothetical protein